MKYFVLILAFTILIPVSAHSKAPDFNINLKFEAIKSGGLKVYVNNPAPYAQQLILRLYKLKNLKTTVNLPFFDIIEPGDNKLLFELERQSSGPVSYRYSYDTFMGSPYAKPDETIYYLPFQHGIIKKATSGIAHKLDRTNAFDFGMDIGSEICAVRDGIVAAIKDDSSFGGPDPAYRPYANFLYLSHSDGTFSQYVHIKKNGVMVKLGDTVKQGQAIALSGNTGYSYTPHLHFQVVIARLTNGTNSFYAIPVKFLDTNGKGTYLKPGNSYYSIHPQENIPCKVYIKNRKVSQPSCL